MKKLLRNKSGTTSIEYAVIAGMLSIVIIVAVAVVGGETKEDYNFVADEVAAL